MTADLHRAPPAGIIRPAEADTTTEALDRMVEWLNDLPCCEDSPRETSARCKSCERDVADTITALRARLAAAEADAERLAKTGKAMNDRFVAWAKDGGGKRALASLDADAAFDEALAAHRARL